MSPGKILLTAGATREPIDAVRFLSNISTGSTGAALADAFSALGHTVTLLRGESAVAPKTPCDMETFSSAVNLWSQLERRLCTGQFDVVVMAAAVSDYRPESFHDGKLSSATPQLVLTLVRNPKILPQLKAFSPRALKVVGFKLTVGADAAARHAAVAAQFAAGGVDCVVQNDLEEIRQTAVHPFRLFTSADGIPEEISGTAALAQRLLAP